MKRFTSIIVALALLLSFAAGAEGEAVKLFDAAKTLAFDTNNVSLSAEATFSYDGEVFKTMHAAYKQDGGKSFLSYMLDTPDSTGKVYTGGYTVIGTGYTAYSNDTYFGNFYDISPTKYSETILSSSNRTEIALDVARGLALIAQDALNITLDGSTYSVSVGDLPEFLDSALYYLVLDYIQDSYYLDLFGDNDYYYDGGLTVSFDDWDELFENKYAEIYGTSYEEDALDESKANVIDGRFQVISDLIYQIEDEALATYPSGYVRITSNGEVVWYETQSDALRDLDEVYVDYANINTSIKRYYAEVYGEELTDDMVDVIMFSPNADLWQAYLELEYAMDDYYGAKGRELDPEAIYVGVSEEGEILTARELPVSYSANSTQNTVTRLILHTLAFAELESLTSQIETDDEGRLIGFSGEVKITTTDTDGIAHALEISFDCKATDYDVTELPDTFVPEDYGLISYEDYIESMDYDEDDDGEDFWEEFLLSAPDEIEFMGKTFATGLDIYK